MPGWTGSPARGLASSDRLAASSAWVPRQPCSPVITPWWDVRLTFGAGVAVGEVAFYGDGG